MERHSPMIKRSSFDGLFFKSTKLICHLLILCSLFGCSSQEKNPIYYEGREFIFQVTISKDSTILKTHKIKLKVTNGLYAKIIFEGKQTGVQWVYETGVDSTTGKTMTETTGVIDDSTDVSLHPPRFGYMAFTEIPPFPDISLPPDTGSTSTITLYGIRGHGDLDGKKIKKTFKVVGETSLTLFKKTYKNVWVIKGENTNYLKELGQYKVTYWFDEKFGFIRMKYEKPNGEIVDMKLEKVKN